MLRAPNSPSPNRINVEETMTDVVERAKTALKALDAETYGGSAESGALRRIARENQFIAQARTLVPDLVAEVERLREAVTAADSILSLLHYRGLVNSENNRRDVAEVSEQLAALRRSGR